MLTIKSGDRSLKLTKDEAHKLELKLNVSRYRHAWSHIGDVLYKFSIGAVIATITVNEDQFDFLYQLHQ